MHGHADAAALIAVPPAPRCRSRTRDSSTAKIVAKRRAGRQELIERFPESATVSATATLNAAVSAWRSCPSTPTHPLPVNPMLLSPFRHATLRGRAYVRGPGIGEIAMSSVDGSPNPDANRTACSELV